MRRAPAASSDTPFVPSWTHLSVRTGPIHVASRQALLEVPDAWVPLGQAPDGLPLLLAVRRSVSVVDGVLSQLCASRLEDLPGEVQARLKALDVSVRQERRRDGVSLTGPVGDGPCYVASRSVQSFFGDTLCARMLGTTSPLILEEDKSWQSHDDRVARTCAGVMLSVAERIQVMESLNADQRVVLPLVEGDVSVVRTVAGQPATHRPIVLESFLHLASARFHAWRREQERPRMGRVRKVPERHEDGPLHDVEAYRKAVRWADAVGWSVSRDDLLRMVAQVALSLEPLHARGLIHCDIKPANLFVGAAGAHAHDSLDVKEGSRASAGTAGWNAPEQVLGRPVGPATDVFALAQLVVSILEGAVFGDERSFVVPVGHGKVQRFNLLGDPDVYLDPTRVPLDDAGVAAWRAFLRRCLALDAEDRLGSVKRFADELVELAEAHPVPGRRSVPAFPGTLVRADGLARGSPGLDPQLFAPPFVAWVIQDQRTPGMRKLRSSPG